MQPNPEIDIPENSTKNHQSHDSDVSHDDHDHNHDSGEWKEKIPLLIGIILLVLIPTISYLFKVEIPKIGQMILYGIAYLLSGYNVLYLAYRKAIRGDFFNEFFLMSTATIGAFTLGEYSEGVAVMVFYSIGEWFQEAAVNRAKNNIKSLLDVRPDEVTVIRQNQPEIVHPKTVQIGEIILIKPGEKAALDGILETEKSSFNTSALTGESVPRTIQQGENVLAGMINMDVLSQVKVTALFSDSKLSQILEMVENANSRKSKTQLFMNRFAKVYTPIVFLLAVLVLVIPYFIVADYSFEQWLYRALVFLVISCPCGLVVSIPLGYFGGIGLASKNGILVKGAHFLDVLAEIDTVVMDKTGTITEGNFVVQKIHSELLPENEFLQLVASAETHSTHPIAQSIVQNAKEKNLKLFDVSSVKEIAGHGIQAEINQKNVLIGNSKLLDSFSISYPKDQIPQAISHVLVAIDSKFGGIITIADTIKSDAKATISALKELQIEPVMLSGDKNDVVQLVAKEIGISSAFGDLLPKDKVTQAEIIKDKGRKLAFVGDGFNDAPVIALSDVGIAMGKMGSDVSIETADVVIQNDHPYQIVKAIKIGKLTKNVVWQNIVLALIIKIAVLILGTFGLANLWEAVIADVGVALLAILNAVRIQNKTIT